MSGDASTMDTGVPAVAGAIATVIFAVGTLPMVIKAARTKDLRSYSRSNILLSNLGNAIHSVYVFSLPAGPIWALHSFYLTTTALMLVCYLRYAKRHRPGYTQRPMPLRGANVVGPADAADVQLLIASRVHERTVGVQDGRPVLADGRVLDATSVIWCTGCDKDAGRIRIPVTGDDGWPVRVRGIVTSAPGLYFVGLPFLQSFASMLIAGVGRDAEHVADHIATDAPRRPNGRAIA
jgi:putative flavoprotein involved in K+ transport